MTFSIQYVNYADYDMNIILFMNEIMEQAEAVETRGNPRDMLRKFYIPSEHFYET